MDSHDHDTGSLVDPATVEQRTVYLSTAARRAQSPYGTDVLAAVALDAAPGWAAHHALPDAVARLVVAVRRDRTVRSGAVPPDAIHPDVPHGDRDTAAQLTASAVVTALWRLAVHPDVTPCPLCTALAVTVHDLTPAGPAGLCARHTGTTHRTEAQA